MGQLPWMTSEKWALFTALCPEPSCNNARRNGERPSRNNCWIHDFYLSVNGCVLQPDVFVSSYKALRLSDLSAALRQVERQKLPVENRVVVQAECAYVWLPLEKPAWGNVASHGKSSNGD